MITIERATLEHARQLRLRPGDLRELEALGLGKMAAIEQSLDRSVEADTYLVGGDVAAIMGVAFACWTGGTAVPWLLTGEPVNRVRKSFLLLTRERTARLLERYRYLENWIDADYFEALRWARWLGFRTSPPEPRGPLGASFVKISMGEPHVV